ncbi:MAG: hypothetical protein ACRD03_10005 [Acidimicrobiales bacterium]
MPITGSAFMDTGEAYGPVEIRWNSLTGSQIGSAAGPSFSVEVSVPNATPGVYYIVAVQRARADNSVVGRSSRAFEVTGSAGTAPVQQEPTPPKPEASVENSPSPQAAPSGPTPTPPAAQTPSSPASPAVGSPSAAGSTAGRPSVPTPTPAPVSAGAVRPTAPAAAAPSATAQAGPTAAPVVPAAGVDQPNIASAPSPAAAEPQPATSDVLPQAESSGSPGSPDTAVRDLSSLEGSTSSGDAPSFAVGVGLLSVGLLVVLASFAVATARRRKVTAH